MTKHIQLIARQLMYLQRLREYLSYSSERIQNIVPIANWQSLGLQQHEILAAFRIRFSEFQEHLGKIMRAIAIEENIDVERFGSVLAFMEKLNIIESSDRWKLIRELRNDINHEYEEDSSRLTEFFAEIVKATPELFDIHNRLLTFCIDAYGITI